MTLLPHDHDYDPVIGIVQRRVFADAAIHARELATVFDRAWLFIAPANWLARPGDFATSRMGDQPVLIWRGIDDQLRLFVNRCPRSDELLTMLPRGNAGSLRCPCHAWPFAAEGFANDSLELDPIPNIADHRGLLFASHNPLVPSFETWLGEFAWYFDLFVPQAGIEAYGEDSFRWLLEANWKLPMLSGCGDFLESPDQLTDPVEGAQISLGSGTVIVRSAETIEGDDPRAGFVPLGAALFPNLIVARDSNSLTVVHPVGPTRCEIHSYCIVDSGSTAEKRDAARRRFQAACGPASVTSGRRGSIWQAVTAGAQSGRHRRQGLTLNLALGQERPSNLPGSFAPLVSEANQRAFFNWWQVELARQVRVAPQLRRVAKRRT